MMKKKAKAREGNRKMDAGLATCNRRVVAF